MRDSVLSLGNPPSGFEDWVSMVGTADRQTDRQVKDRQVIDRQVIDRQVVR